MNKDKNSIVSPDRIPSVVEAFLQHQDINNSTPEIQKHYLPQYVQPPATQYYPDYTQQQQVYLPQYVQPPATQYYPDYTQQQQVYVPQYYYYVYPQSYYAYNNYVADKTCLAQEQFM
jgi:hypothetical protein